MAATHVQRYYDDYLYDADQTDDLSAEELDKLTELITKHLETIYALGDRDQHGGPLRYEAKSFCIGLAKELRANTNQHLQVSWAKSKRGIFEGDLRNLGLAIAEDLHFTKRPRLTDFASSGQRDSTTARPPNQRSTPTTAVRATATASDIDAKLEQLSRELEDEIKREEDLASRKRKRMEELQAKVTAKRQKNDKDEALLKKLAAGNTKA